MSHILSIDQGTTSTRAVVFGPSMDVVSLSQKEITQYFPQSGWVEHDPAEILESVLFCVRNALASAKLGASDIAAIGITNQRETTVVWDRETGEPVGRAIVWQDRRTAEVCTRMRRDGLEDLVRNRTGLLLDPYFSATKLAWILNNVPSARQRAEAGKLLFGTIDCFLIWHLTGGEMHLTDATNASRTMLYNIRTGEWDASILNLLDIPSSVLPRVMDCAAEFGSTSAALFGRSIPICGVAGDQHAALIGQACFAPGMIKATFGTGGFAMINTGSDLVCSKNRLLTTIAYRLGGEVTYALEGSIFVAGATVQWLRDSMGLLAKASDASSLAQRADPGQSVFLVPAFVGLGAPHWDANARGAIFGLTRNTGPAEFARAALESVVFQTVDLVEAMHRDWRQGADVVLRVDGGMAVSDWTMQCLADVMNAPVDRPRVTETTAFGAAWLAAHHAGVWPNADAFSRSWEVERRFEPGSESRRRRGLIPGWRDAVRRTLTDSSVQTVDT